MTISDERLYFRPCGIVTGSDADIAVQWNDAVPLAGGPEAFSLLEVIRLAGNGVNRRLVRVGDRISAERLAGEDLVENLVSSRAPIAGLDPSATHIMGVLNVTPDSFFDGGRFVDVDKAIAAGREMIDQGATIIDVGGESTRPGAQTVSVDDEIARVVPVIAGLAAQGIGPISVDTRKAAVMSAAIEAGASIINDVSAMTYDPDSLDVAVRSGLPVILMHAQGTPQVMQKDPQYRNVLFDVFDYLKERVEVCLAAGMTREKLIVDPGIGFGKTLEHNLELLKGLGLFHGLGVPLLLGVSRKSFIAKLDGNADVASRLPGSLAALASAIGQKVQFLRVHDVAETRQFLRVFQAIDRAEPKF